VRDGDTRIDLAGAAPPHRHRAAPPRHRLCSQFLRVIQRRLARDVVATRPRRRRRESEPAHGRRLLARLNSGRLWSLRHHLLGREQQRVTSRAASGAARHPVLDEPTASLEFENSAAVVP